MCLDGQACRLQPDGREQVLAQAERPAWSKGLELASKVLIIDLHNITATTGVCVLTDVGDRRATHGARRESDRR